jgi:hypothetical protein
MIVIMVNGHKIRNSISFCVGVLVLVLVMVLGRRSPRVVIIAHFASYRIEDGYCYC